MQRSTRHHSHRSHLGPVAAATLLGALALAGPASGQSWRWIEQFGTHTDDPVGGAASDGSGGVYLSGGWTTASLGGPHQGLNDVWFARYAGDGNRLWIRQLGTPGSDHAEEIVADASGGAFVCGHTGGALGGPLAGYWDAWIARYDGSGNPVWIRQFGTSSGYDSAFAVEPDGSGGVFVCGYTDANLGGSSAGMRDAWVARYDAGGSRLWIRQLGTPHWDEAHELASDGAGGVFVGMGWWGHGANPSPSGIGRVARFDGTGALLWTRSYGAGGTYGGLLASHPQGGVFAGGLTNESLSGPNAGGVDVWLARLDASGSQQWIRQLGTPANDASMFEATDATADGRGGVYIGSTTGGDLGGPSGGGNDAWWAHFDESGTMDWIEQFGTNQGDTVAALAVDPGGDVFVAGGTRGDLAAPNAGPQGSTDAFVARCRPYVRRYCAPAAINSTGTSARLDAVGSIVVADDDLTLVASQLPPNAFGFFLTSRDEGHVPGAGGSFGTLCLGGAIGRYVGPGEIQNAGASGTFQLALDLARHPTPTGLVAVAPGETWNFQAWYRDANPVPTSNFTDAVSVTFQ